MRTFMPCLLMVALLCGCANIEQKSGAMVQGKAAIGRQEPWQNMALVGGNMVGTEAISVAYITIPEPTPDLWKKEFVDANRVYEVVYPDGKKARKPLERVVFRALLYKGDQHVRMYDAVLNPQLTGFFVILPSSGEYVGHNLAILSSDARWLMTTHGEIVMLDGQSPTELPQGFFTSHPSAMTQVVTMERHDPAGKRFLDDLERFFPQQLVVNGIEYSGRPDTKTVAAKFTQVDHPLDRAISCGSLVASSGMPVVSLAVSAARTAYVVTKEDCFH